MELREKILSCPSLPGASEKMTLLLREELEKYGCSFATDALSNAFFTKQHAQGKHLMICCGIDVGGVIATSVEGSKIYVGALGSCKELCALAYCKVVFDGICGILIPPDGYTSSTDISECFVETFDSEVEQKILPGDKGYFDTPINTIASKAVWGYGIGEKMCINTVVSAAAFLFSKDGAECLKKHGIGSITASFLGQHSLSARGSAVAANKLCPDEIILIAPFDLGKDDTRYKYVVKVLDNSYTAEDALLQKVCDFFNEKGISFKKAVSTERNSAIANLSHALNSPSCIEIGLAVHNFCAVTLEQ